MRREMLQSGFAGLDVLGFGGLGLQGSSTSPDPSLNTDQRQGRLLGKVVAITGATSGIGEATARAFEAEGAIVYSCGRREALGEQMASVSAHRGYPNTAHYSTSKHGVIGLTKADAVGNADYNIRVNSSSPLAVGIPMLRESFAFQKLTYEDAAKTFVTERIMDSIEIARAVMFLASDDASSITGMDLDVTGGQLA